jgi:hypothetical protein
MILPASKLEGFLYFTYDDYIKSTPVTKVKVFREVKAKWFSFWKKEICDVYSFNMIQVDNDKITTYYKSEPCNELIEQLNKLQLSKNSSINLKKS